MFWPLVIGVAVLLLGLAGYGFWLYWQLRRNTCDSYHAVVLQRINAAPWPDDDWADYRAQPYDREGL
jgi:hypothetical protein